MEVEVASWPDEAWWQMSEVPDHFVHTAERPSSCLEERKKLV
jgi:hypothetical protein